MQICGFFHGVPPFEEVRTQNDFPLNHDSLFNFAICTDVTLRHYLRLPASGNFDGLHWDFHVNCEHRRQCLCGRNPEKWRFAFLDHDTTWNVRSGRVTGAFCNLFAGNPQLCTFRDHAIDTGSSVLQTKVPRSELKAFEMDC